MTGAMVLAGGFDYLTNLVAGSMLGPVAFGAFVAVAAIVQIMVHVTNVILQCGGVLFGRNQHAC